MNRMALFLITAVFSLPAYADEDVAAAQKAKLISSVQAKLGAPVTGKPDAKTEAALQEFQRAKGIEPTGKLDKRTVTALGLDGPKYKPAAGGASSAEAKPTTPIGPEQSSAERTAEPQSKTEQPTGEK